MRYTVDLVKKEILIFNYDKKWKKYLDLLEKVYKTKGFEFTHLAQDNNDFQIDLDKYPLHNIDISPYNTSSTTITTNWEDYSKTIGRIHIVDPSKK